MMHMLSLIGTDALKVLDGKKKSPVSRYYRLLLVNSSRVDLKLVYVKVYNAPTCRPIANNYYSRYNQTE